jgi:hypothetical protein
MIGMNPSKIAELNEFGEAEAQANYYLSASTEFARPFRLEVKRIGSILVTMIAELDHAFFNRIIGLGIGEPATESMLDEAIAVFQNAGCKTYMAQVCPLAQPSQVPEWLAIRGFQPSRNWAKMYRSTEPAKNIPTDLRIEKIGKDQADAFAGVVLTAFEMPRVLRPLAKGFIGQPGWHHYLAFENEKPVSASAMFVNGEVTWLGFGSTLKKYRKHGGQGAMFARRIQDAIELGCKWFVTETGEDTVEDPNPSYHNMLRSGFKLAYLRRNYVHQPPLHVGKVVRRSLFVVAYSIRYELHHLMRQGRAG